MGRELDGEIDDNAACVKCRNAILFLAVKQSRDPTLIFKT